MSHAMLEAEESLAHIVAYNLRLLIKKSGKPTIEIARAVSLPYQTVHRIASGTTPDPGISKLKKLADYFQVSTDYLLTPHQAELSQQILAHNQVPVLSWQEASDSAIVDGLIKHQWKHWEICDQEIYKQTVFALETRPSMQDRFPPGTILFIDPHESPRDNDLVCVKFNAKGLISLRELIIDGPKWILRPLVANVPVAQFDPQVDVICGVVIQTRFVGKRVY